MRIGLLDFNWTGHHTPYVALISRSLLDRGHSVTVITDQEHPRLDSFPDHSDFDVSPVDLSEYKTNNDVEAKIGSDGGFTGSLQAQWTGAKQIGEALNTIADSELDILHMLYYEGNQLPLRLATYLNDVTLPEIIVTIHRDAFTDGGGGLPKTATRKVTCMAVNSCLSDGTISQITVHSTRSQNRIIESLSHATQDNVRTFHAPTPAVSGELSQAEARSELKLPDGLPLLLFFGELRHEKGPDILYKAIKQVDVPVAVVYAGPEYDFTKERVQQWAEDADQPVKLIPRVEFIPEEEVDNYFISADALVVPYRRERGISGPLRRACMANRHIIGPDSSDIGSIIQENGLGQTFERGSTHDLKRTIVEYAQNQSRYPRPGVEKYAEKLHWKETGRELENLYSTAMDTKHL